MNSPTLSDIQDTILIEAMPSAVNIARPDISQQGGNPTKITMGRRSKILPLLAAAAIGGIALVGNPSEAQADGSLVGARLRAQATAIFNSEDPDSYFKKLIFDGTYTYTTWNDESMLTVNAGTGVTRPDFYANINAGYFNSNCNNPTNGGGSNCTGINNPAPLPGQKPKVATLNGGNINANIAGGLGAFTLAFNGSAVLSQSLSLLGVANAAWRIFNNENGGLAVKGIVQERDNVFSAGGGFEYLLIGGTPGLDGRVWAAKFSAQCLGTNQWGTPTWNSFCVISLGFTTENKPKGDAPLNLL